MKRNFQIRNHIVSIICCLYALLFAYAATSKVLDFENFQIQLGQSPLLSSFASLILFAVPAAEIIIAILLLIEKYRLIGLFSAYTLMVLFTAYIYILLHYSAFVPCSCGGIIQKLSWSQHIIFNICFIVMAGIAVVLLPGSITLHNPETSKSWH
ncbi:MauE/DoxX family redox-associated membrane protein [Flavobacterium sp. IMCC34518]|uniref:MauE/DoxX family redox-associated membrane protein n=1 Tax=Flavobacterium sp. IMCC34518 TaxID=3003623 RepID=UPI0022ABD841|nr:MauE/DoxX family redox-associated membrane protein [Flavobacterium sp. IMCC34518]